MQHNGRRLKLDNRLEVVSEYMSPEGLSGMESQSKGTARHKVGLHTFLASARTLSYRTNAYTILHLNALFEIACHAHVAVVALHCALVSRLFDSGLSETTVKVCAKKTPVQSV